MDVVLRGYVWAQSVGVRQNVFLYTFTTTPLEVRRLGIDRWDRHPDVPRPLLCGVNVPVAGDLKSRTRPEGITINMASRMYKQTQAAAEAETAAKTGR